MHLQRVIAIGRQAREIVGDLNAVRALDKGHEAVRLIAYGGQQLRIGALFLWSQEYAAAAQ